MLNRFYLCAHWYLPKTQEIREAGFPFADVMQTLFHTNLIYPVLN